MSRQTSIDNEALLRRHGLLVTAQRLALLRAVSDRPHSTADDIDKVVRAEIALAALTDKGLLRRIQPAGSPAHYENGSVITTTTSSAEPAAGWSTSTVRSATPGA